MKLRVFSCNSCGHRNPLGAELCERCEKQTPVMNWSGIHLAAFYFLIAGGIACAVWY